MASPDSPLFEESSGQSGQVDQPPSSPATRTYQELLSDYGLEVPSVYQSEYVNNTDDEDDVARSADPYFQSEGDYFCPIYLGEVLNERYVIENKLG